MMDPLVAAIDQGTSSTRFLVSEATWWWDFMGYFGINSRTIKVIQFPPPPQPSRCCFPRQKTIQSGILKLRREPDSWLILIMCLTENRINLHAHQSLAIVSVCQAAATVPVFLRNSKIQK